MAEESTTPDLVELARRAFAGVNRRDFDAMDSFYAPRVVWDMSQAGLPVIEGREALRAFFEEWLGAYEEHEQKVEEIQDLGNGVVFAVFVQRARPVGSSGWVEFRDARVLLCADGLIERVNTFLDVDQARAAAERLTEERG